MGADAGVRLAGLLLRREVLVDRAKGAPAPHSFAGLVIEEPEADWLVEGDPEGGGGDEVTAVRATFGPAVDAARRHLRDEMDRSTSPLGRLARSARLDGDALEVLAVTAALEADVTLQRLASFAQNDVTRTRLSLHWLRRLLGDGAVAAVGPDGALHAAGLVRLEGDGPWSSLSVTVPVSVSWVLAGLDSRDDLPAGARCWDSDDSGTDGHQPEPILLLVTGGDRARRRRLATTAGVTRFVTSPPPADDGWEPLVRYATLTGRAVALELDELTPAARRWIERASHLTWVLSSTSELPLDALPARRWQEIRAPDGPATDDEWRQATGERAPGEYRLWPSQVDLVAGARDGLEGGIAGAVRRLAGGHLGRWATCVHPSRAWDDLVVPADQDDALHDLCRRYRLRGTVYDAWGFGAHPSAGLVALFSGPPGTGKTLAAEVVAADLGLDLYRLDLSALVSKYIGETEKNLEEVFAAAGAGELVLFFDEADALFGKRSEVADAHDRYANIEVSYLLQRLERHDGLVILATNLQHNIDPAFLRRIHALVDFPEPDAEHRRRIWARSFPERAPVNGIDVDGLAERFRVTGGHIRGAALHAAFLAAAEQSPISEHHVLSGLRRELRKLGRLTAETGLGPWYPLSEGRASAAPAR